MPIAIAPLTGCAIATLLLVQYVTVSSAFAWHDKGHRKGEKVSDIACLFMTFDSERESGVIYAIFHRQNVKYQLGHLQETNSLKPTRLPRIQRDTQ